MWMIYGKRTKEPYVDKQFRMLTAKVCAQLIQARQ